MNKSLRKNKFFLKNNAFPNAFLTSLNYLKLDNDDILKNKNIVK